MTQRIFDVENEKDFNSREEAIESYFGALNSKVKFITFSPSLLINKDLITQISIKEDKDGN